jgi:hypothetical protein
MNVYEVISTSNDYLFNGSFEECEKYVNELATNFGANVNDFFIRKPYIYGLLD